MTAVMLGAAVVARVPWPVVAVIGMATVDPLPAALLLVAFGSVAAVQRRTGSARPDEAAFHAAVAAELRSGSSLRMALVEAGRRVPNLMTDGVVRGLRQGTPLDDLAETIAAALSSTGRLFAPGVVVAASAGGRAAVVFDRLAMRAADARALARERRTASAQARLSAWIVGGLPVFAIGLSFAGGRLGALTGGAVGRAVLVVGLVLVGAGVLSVVLILRRSAA